MKEKVVKFVPEERKRQVKRELIKERQVINRNRENFNFITSLLGIIFTILLVAYVIRILNNESTMPTFKSLLETLTTSQNTLVDMSFNTLDLTTWLQGDWGIFEFMQSFLKVFLSVGEYILNLLVFVGKAVFNLLVYLVSLLKWLVGGANVV